MSRSSILLVSIFYLILSSNSSTQVISNLEAGNNQIQIINQGQGLNTYFTIPFRNSIAQPDVALSIENIINFKPKTGMYFKIYVLGTSSTSFNANFEMEQQANWTKLQIGYVATARSDFIIGTLIIDNRILNSNNNQIAQITTKINKYQYLQLQHWLIIPFITGISTIQNDFSVQLVDKSFNPKTKNLSFKIKFQYQNNPINQLQLTYLLFHNRGQLDILTLNSVYNPPIQSIHGIKSLQAQSSYFGQARLLSIFWKTQQQVFNQIFGLHGVVIQTQNSPSVYGFKFNCASNYYFNGNNCQILPSSPPSPGEYKTFRNCRHLPGANLFTSQINGFKIVSKCIVCPQNSVFQSFNGKCLCDIGLYFSEWKCLPYNLNSVTNPNNQNNNGQVNQQPQDGQDSSQEQPPNVIQCQDPFVFNSIYSTCLCPRGKYPVDNKCQSCYFSEKQFNGECIKNRPKSIPLIPKK